MMYQKSSDPSFANKVDEDDEPNEGVDQVSEEPRVERAV